MGRRSSSLSRTGASPSRYSATRRKGIEMTGPVGDELKHSSMSEATPNRQKSAEADPVCIIRTSRTARPLTPSVRGGGQGRHRAMGPSTRRELRGGLEHQPQCISAEKCGISPSGTSPTPAETTSSDILCSRIPDLRLSDQQCLIHMSKTVL